MEIPTSGNLGIRGWYPIARRYVFAIAFDLLGFYFDPNMVPSAAVAALIPHIIVYYMVSKQLLCGLCVVSSGGILLFLFGRFVRSTFTLCGSCAWHSLCPVVAILCDGDAFCGRMAAALAHEVFEQSLCGAAL